MKIDFPLPGQQEELTALWQEAFGDTEEFIDGFFCTGFAPSRCRCVTLEGKVAAALYWFEASCEGRRFAYIYAVATAKAHRGKGIFRRLMEDTQAHLKLRGYDGILLVPQTEALRATYAAMGYEDCTCVREFTCEKSDNAAQLHRIDRDTYAALRRQYLPRGGVVQDEDAIAYLEMMAFFYKGDGFLMAAAIDGNTLWCPEILGDVSAAPGILKALNFETGRFRTCGDEIPFAMYLPLGKKAVAPTYFGLAFD